MLINGSLFCVISREEGEYCAGGTVSGFASYKYITNFLVQTFLASLLFSLQDIWTNIGLN